MNFLFAREQKWKGKEEKKKGNENIIVKADENISKRKNKASSLRYRFCR